LSFPSTARQALNVDSLPTCQHIHRRRLCIAASSWEKRRRWKKRCEIRYLPRVAGQRHNYLFCSVVQARGPIEVSIVLYHRSWWSDLVELWFRTCVLAGARDVLDRRRCCYRRCKWIRQVRAIAALGTSNPR